jgi:hypothetical protein
MLVRSHAHKEEKKKEGYTTESRMAVVAFGIKKKRERKEKNVHIHMYGYLSLSLSLFLFHSIDSDNKVNQYKEEK